MCDEPARAHSEANACAMELMRLFSSATAHGVVCRGGDVPSDAVLLNDCLMFWQNTKRSLMGLAKRNFG